MGSVERKWRWLPLIALWQVAQAVQLFNSSQWFTGYSLAKSTAHGVLDTAEADMEFLGHEVQKRLEAAESAFSAVPGGPDQGLHFRPVSMTLWAVMGLTFIALITHLMLSVFRNADELSGDFRTSMATKTMTVAARPTAFVPMLSMLFVTCRMYVLAQTEGLGEPQPWTKGSMFVASFGMVLQFVLLLVLPSFTIHSGAEEAAYDMTEGKNPAASLAASDQASNYSVRTPRSIAEDTDTGAPEDDIDDVVLVEDIVELTGDVPDAHPTLHRVKFKEEVCAAQAVFWGIQVVSIVALYGGVLGVLVGMATYPQERSTSPAILCTVALAVPYFAVHLRLWLGRVFHTEGLTEHIGLAASTPIRKAPMFCVVFLAARMRSLELDPPHGMPSHFATACFYICTIAYWLELIGAVLNVVCGAVQKKVYYGQYFYEAQDKKWVQALKEAFAVISYLAVLGIAVDFTLEVSSSVEPAPLSTTVKCTLAMAFGFFAIAASQSILTMLEALEVVEEKHVLRDTIVAAGVSFSLAPIICILFVATRMRALQITQAHGDPPGWAQDSMLMCTFAVYLQSVCCLLMPIFIGSATKIDDSGNPDYDLQPMIGAYAVTMVKYVALFTLYGGVCVICAAVILMTPATANSSGRMITDLMAFVKAMVGVSFVFVGALLLSSAKVVGLGVKFAIESCDKALLGVDINVRHVAFSLAKGYVKVSDLRVEQPPGKWREKHLAKVRLVLVKINLWRCITSLGKVIEIQNISCEGIHVNIEKPNTVMKEPNSNVEYVTEHIHHIMGGLEGLGLDLDQLQVPSMHLPPVEELDTQIVLHKIAIGDVGVCVHVQSPLGHLRFHPHVPTLEFNDVQKEVCHGREDVTPKLLVALVIKAIIGKVLYHVATDIPSAVARATQNAAKGTLQRVMGGVRSVVRTVTGAAEG